MGFRPTRRKFLQGSAAVLSGRLLGHAADFASTPAVGPSREVLREFPFGAVAITSGPLKQQYDRIHASYLALDNDRLLKVYRQRAGLPAPGPDMGGWYDADGFVPGHSLGQYISGLARIAAATGDPACEKKVRALVLGFGATLGANNQSIIRPQTNLWICYTLDKHFAGLIDAYTLAHVDEARDLLPRVFDGSRSLMPQHGHDRIGKKNPPYDETYVMPENLFSAYQLTGRHEFQATALHYLLDHDFFDPLARNENVLPGRHAYSHAIALSSAAKAYLVLGDEKYRRAMAYAWTCLTTEQQFASGGWGPNEQFVEPQTWTLRLRIPGWLDGPARITVNGATAAPAKPGSFAALRRRWKGGDLVELRLPQAFRAEPIDDLHPNVVAVMRGPLMLVAIDPPDGLEKRPLPIEEGFRALGQRADAWTRNEGGEQIVFVPFYQVQNEQYTTYFTRG